MHDQSPIGLYVHVPFCAAICRYCNFNRGLFDRDLKDRYLAAVEAEIRSDRLSGLARPSGVAADTVYFGGGTPSLLRPAEIARILAACRGRFDLAPGAEVTLEANPESLDQASLDGYRRAGVTRLSIGVQSFRDDELTRLGRLHDRARAVEALAAARRAGFDNVSLDLMMWLPGQSLADWDASIDGLLACAPEHASLYILELYPGAPLREDMARQRWSQAPDDDAAEMYERGLARLEAAGLRQYEISNVARPGRESRHNLKYWTDGEWRGFGPGAHSTVGGVRWKNVPGAEDYAARAIAGAPVGVEHRVLTPEERRQEAIITGLRLRAGIDTAAFARRYGLDLWGRYGDDLEPCIEAGLLERDRATLRLSRRGLLLANEVMRVFI